MFLKTWVVHKGVNKGAFVKWIVEAHELQQQVGPSHLAQECLGSAVCLQLSCHFSGGVSSALIWVLPGSCGIYQRTPLLLWFWGQHLLTVKQFPLGHGNLAGGLSADCTPGAGSSCQAFLPTPRDTVSPEWNTSGCEYWKMKWCAFWGFSHLGKKLGWKVKHCIIFLWWLQTVSVGV